MARRVFRLPEADETFLDGFGLVWETLVEANLRWLVLRDFSIPKGFNRDAADVAILIQPAYPPGVIDSAYISPPLDRVDGRPIPNATGEQQIEGRKWQFWSRHRTPDNPWIDGEDDLSSHIHWMQSWLAGELERSP